ncbi:MAG: hypothetical protein FWF20_00820 [Betaproteobacteria bacterium]|nr:hypothetical protein [Betaproteobacteria bacterium]
MLGACGSPGSNTSPLLPDKKLQLTGATSIKLSSLAAAAAVAAVIYVVYDPLAPNWEIEESRLGENVYRLSMKMKRFHTGGAGESMQVLKRRASQLQMENGYHDYQIVDYNEGIDSQTLGARRVAEGLIRLVRHDHADSFLQD